MSNQEIHPIFTELANRYLEIDEGGRHLKVEELSLPPANLAGAADRVTTFAYEVTERYNDLLARWPGRAAVANEVMVVTDFHPLMTLPQPDRQGRTTLEVQAEKFDTRLGFVFQVDGGLRPARPVMKVEAILPVREPELAVLTSAAKQIHRVKLRTRRYEGLHRVDQITAALDEVFAFDQ